MQHAVASRQKSKRGAQTNARGVPLRLATSRGMSNHRFLQRKCACGGAAQSAGECSECKAKRDAAPASASEMARGQAAPTPGPGTTAAPAPVPELSLVAAQAMMDRADDLRIAYLTEARQRVRQVQIACQEQADAQTITDIFPEEIRAFLSAFGVGPWTPNFCLEVALIHSDIEKNLYMSLPPFYFPGISAPLDSNDICVLLPTFWASYEDYQIRICPTVLASDKRDIDRALILTHEVFHEPSFAMGHAHDVMDTQHCGAVGGDSQEMMSNPYCVTKFVGMVGGHLRY